MKLTAENLSSKLGKLVDIASIREIALSNKQIDEVGSFAQFQSLEMIDLSNNRIQLKRQLEGIFDAPNLKMLKLVGNPITRLADYKQYVLSRMPKLEVLDDQPVAQATITDPLLNPVPVPVTKQTDPLISRTQAQDSKEDNKKVPTKEVKEEVIQKPTNEAPQKQTNESTQKSTNEAKPKPTNEPKTKPTNEPKPKPANEASSVIVEQVSQKEPKGEESTKLNDEVFQDSRSKLVIKAHIDANQTEAPPTRKYTPPQNTVDSEDLFGDRRTNKKLNVEDIDSSLLSVDDDLSVFETKKTNKQPIHKPAQPVSQISSMPQASVDVDDELFSLAGASTNNSALSSLDVTAYISNLKVQDTSKGGLFD